MSLSTQPYKGTRDFYPEDKRKQKYMFSVLRRVVESFGYQEYDAPLIEPFDIYAAKTGEEIVNEQLYSFEDRGGRKVAIRPEMTPTVSRMVAGRRQELAYPLRWYSIPNLWRYERPQRGRLREHWQLNVDIFGEKGTAADFEIIQVADSVLQAFGANRNSYTIKINSRQLVNYLLTEVMELNGEQAQTVAKLIDRRDKMPSEEFIAKTSEILGPKVDVLSAFLTTDDVKALPDIFQGKQFVQELSGLMALLEQADIANAVFDPSIMRGLDYYTDIVFEVYDNDPENNRSMFGGGRYDGLVGAFGVEPVPTVGFGMGDVTLQNFLESNGLMPKITLETDAVIILVGDVFEAVQPLISGLRAKGINLAVDATDRKLDSKIKNAAKGGAEFVIFVGEQELENGQFKLKNLESGDEQELSPEQLVQALAKS